MPVETRRSAEVPPLERLDEAGRAMLAAQLEAAGLQLVQQAQPAKLSRAGGAGGRGLLRPCRGPGLTGATS
jgi:hypothetical protein